jgi:Tfp pilus assembly protein PilZ
MQAKNGVTGNRKFPRKSLDVVVNCSDNAIARAKDLSKGGIGLITEKPLQAGSFIKLQFVLPNTTEKIGVFGKVVWCKLVSPHLYESGVEFWQIDDLVMNILDKYLEEENA